MEFIGKIINIQQDFKTGERFITFSTKTKNVFTEVDEFKNKLLNVVVNLHYEIRGNKANRLFWKCCTLIAEKAGVGRWEEYLTLIKDYGVHTDIYVKKDMIDQVRAQWRETEVIGEPDNRGWVHLMCWLGSHTYNKAQFSRLINGTMQEMDNLGIQLPEADYVRKCLDEVENE